MDNQTLRLKFVIKLIKFNVLVTKSTQISQKYVCYINYFVRLEDCWSLNTRASLGNIRQ